MNSDDKIALGGGGYCLYGPRYPRFQDRPGFADPVSIFSAELPNLMFLQVLENALPVPMTLTERKLSDGKLVNSYNLGRGLRATETRMVTQDDRFVSLLELQNTGKTDRQLTTVVWTTTDPEGEAVSLEGDSFRIKRNLESLNHSQVPVEIVWSSPDSKGAKAMQPFFAEGGGDRPDWEETPWYDMPSLPTPRAKRPMEKPSPILESARVWCGLFREIALKGNTKQEHRYEANVIFKGKGLNYRPRRPDPKDENTYSAFMGSAPRFTCSDWPELERVVKQRFEALHLLRVPHGAGKVSAPSVCQGQGPLHLPTAISGPAAIREARWLQDATLARGVLRSFFENVKQSGQVPAALSMLDTSNDHVHGDWGGAFEALDDIHPDRATKRAVLAGMQRYVKWLYNNRDPEGSGLTDVTNQFESGQPLSRRFTIIDDKSDRAEELSEQFRIKAIDASVFRHRLVKFLIRVADDMQEKAMANRFIAEEEVIKETIRKQMWDEKSGIFVDLDPKAPKSRRKTGVKSAAGFYTLATDIPTSEQVEKMLDTLSVKKEFWTEYGVPSISTSDPWYQPDGHWKGTRREMAFNGRVWPRINSHVLEGLAYVAERGNKKAQRLCSQLFRKTIDMVSGKLEGADQCRVFEHYHPETGRPARFRGNDVVMDAFLLDNIFRIGCGIAVRFGEIQDDPVIGDMPDFKLHGVPLGNKVFNVERKNGKLKIQQP